MYWKGVVCVTWQNLFALCGIDETVQSLTGIYSSESAAEQELEHWFSSVDFESLPPEVSCMAAVAAAGNGFSGTPADLIPRLRGIIKYVHTLNAGMISGVCMLGEALNKAQIPLILLGDTALYLTSPKAPERHLWQMRIGVPEADYSHTLKIAREAGFRVEEYRYTALVSQNATRQITIIPLPGSAGLWQGASECKKGNAVFLCPERGEVLISVCQDTFRALTRNTPRSAMIRWVMDFTSLSRQLTEQDWHLAAKAAKQEQACAHVYLLCMLYAGMTGQYPAQTSLFGDGRDADTLLKALECYLSHPKKGGKLRRSYLLCRMRRPDSAFAAALLFLRQILRKALPGD